MGKLKVDNFTLLVGGEKVLHMVDPDLKPQHPI